MLEVRGLTKRYTTVTAIDDVSFAVKPYEVLGYLDGARDLKVLVIGETIIDEYQYCSAIGKSSKEPMLAVKCSNTETFAGGIIQRRAQNASLQRLFHQNEHRVATAHDQ